jgi:excisionase family DNA binding protein
MNTSIFTSLSSEDLKEIIKACIKEELSVYFENVKTERPGYDMLSMKEVSKMLGVSKPTIIKWTKQGLLYGQRIGRRVYYKRDVVEKSLKQYQGPIITEARVNVALNRWKNL